MGHAPRHVTNDVRWGASHSTNVRADEPNDADADAVDATNAANHGLGYARDATRAATALYDAPTAAADDDDKFWNVGSTGSAAKTIVVRRTFDADSARPTASTRASNEHDGS